MLLKRRSHHQEPSVWAIPGGKLERGETPKEALLREIFEETALSLRMEAVIFIKTLFLEKPGCAYTYHMFYYALPKRPLIQLSDEHTAFEWCPVNKILQLPVLIGTKETLDVFLEEAQHRGVR